MNTWVRHWSERLRTNLWFIPTSLVLLAIALSSAMLAADARFGNAYGTRFLFTGGPDGASAVLGAIAGSMIGVTGVTFSITVVALGLASQQFGPRLLRGFIRDRGNQVVLGVFVGTFTYSLLGLRAVDGEAGAHVPEITVNVAILLALLSLAFLIYFIHHIATSIQADTIIAGVASDLHRSIEELYPERLGRPAEDDVPHLPPDFASRSIPVVANGTGYVQAIAEEGLMEIATREDLLVRVEVRPGDFIVEGEAVLRVLSRAPPGADVVDALAETVLVGPRPTSEQDIEFTLAQLVEVANRALSPGINDPLTAIRCIDRLGAALCVLARRRFPSPARVDEDGRMRVVARITTWEGALGTAFDQVRQTARRDIATTMAILAALDRVLAVLPEGDPRRSPVERQAARTYRGALIAPHEEDDLADLSARYARLAT